MEAIGKLARPGSRNQDIGAWGTFASPETEREFRAAHLPLDKVRILRVLPVFAAAVVLFGFNDWRLYGWDPLFWQLFVSRLAGLAFLGVLARIMRRARDARALDRAILILLLTPAVLNSVLTAVRPAWFTSYLTADAVFLFTLYAAISAPLRLQVVPAVVLTLGSVSVFALTKTPRDGSTLLSLAATYLLVHTIGVVTSLELNRRKRLQYADRMREAALRHDLEESEARHRQTQQVARLGGWEFEIASRQIRWSDEVYRLFDWDRRVGPPNLDQFFALLPAAARRELRVVVERALATGVPYTLQHRFDSPDGSYRYLRQRGQPVKDESGRVVRLIGTVQDVTERVEAEERLIEVKEEAEAASRAKAEFLAMMSHELRTPMNGVLGMASLLADTALTEEQRDYVSTIETSGRALLEIINDVLDISKIEAGKLSIEKIPFDLRAVVSDSLRMVEGPARLRHLELKANVDAKIPQSVDGDPVRIKQVLVNLLSNAVKFTKVGGVTLDVRLVSEDGRRVRWTVTDTGIGIPDAVKQQLFEIFTQGDSSTTRRFGGTGLGLAISRRLTELMDGTIGVDSVEGKGSAFWFEVPVSESV
ncbi:MAG: ATP-binding protein [Bryobacteraceae bacterium]